MQEVYCLYFHKLVGFGWSWNRFTASDPWYISHYLHSNSHIPVKYSSLSALQTSAVFQGCKIRHKSRSRRQSLTVPLSLSSCIVSDRIRSHDFIIAPVNRLMYFRRVPLCVYCLWNSNSSISLLIRSKYSYVESYVIKKP